MVIEWNLLEGYQGLMELAEIIDEVWEMSRNQGIAGGLGNRGLCKVTGMGGLRATAATGLGKPPVFLSGPSHSCSIPGPGENTWSPQPLVAAATEIETGCFQARGRCPASSLIDGKGFVQGNESSASRACYKESAQLTDACCRCCSLNPGENTDAS